ncbi:hypothetical protein Srot_0643 [Segniliparus rotundus DSM 44985]|uniref:Uncharacterized protein n=1 Tax=Segniliparus rotundus (strain ATCC BAA-972 / CDC 1076 / CIP 108378 / DSM 44985 / JCM 13578) TaxID=640132 RepID=D6ZCT3_SEGRD|nr:hypothetical protein [Segniliparus rotundus]ADG97125.1 hypothetical protein Srot_0643 [Segniliparus rotundus DSM 44985]
MRQSGIKFPAVSWAAATWSAPTSVAATLMSCTVVHKAQEFYYAQRHQRVGDEKLTLYVAVCALFVVAALALWFGVRTPVARGIALGVVGFPFVLAWFSYWIVG